VNPTLRSIRISANGRTIVATEDFSYTENEITFLFGESGIGKSMLCKATFGLLDPDELTITVENASYRDYVNDPRTRAIKQSSFFVFQEPSTHLHPLMRITEQLREGSIRAIDSERDILGRLWKTVDDAALRRVIDVYPKPYRPSGGEKQRVLLAMAFKKIALLAKAQSTLPTFFVFDEPTGSLDNSYRNTFLEFLFDEYRKRSFTAMVITHDYSIISQVLERHSDLVKRIHYRELTRRDKGWVEIRDFSPSDYLTWLKTASAKRTAGRSDSEIVLETDSVFEIFGREHRLFSDSARTRETQLVIRRGEMAYVKAPSGVGKTTLAKIIMGLYHPDRFGMTLCGNKVTHETPQRFYEKEIWGRKAGMVFQHADEALDMQASVEESFKGLPLSRPLTRDDLHRALAELFEGGVTDTFLRKKVKFLSGGQKQRLNLLRTMILHPDLIILDEPLNGLDFESVRKIIAMLEEKKREGSALLMISHNEEIFDALVGRESVYYLS
jgi:peptide/nickel transport system ATP-binding protein